MKAIIWLSNLAVFVSSHIISNNIKDEIGKACLETGTLRELEDAIDAAFKESEGRALDFNFLIPEHEGSILKSYPTAVVTTPEKLELLVKKAGAQLEWSNSYGTSQIVQYPAMNRAINSLDMPMMKMVLELGGSMRPCNAQFNLIYDLCLTIVHHACCCNPDSIIAFFRAALLHKKNWPLLDDINNKDGLTCIGCLFKLGCKDINEVKFEMLELLLQSGASVFTVQRNKTTPLETIVTWSSADLIVLAMNEIFVKHPSNNPFHPTVDLALSTIEPSEIDPIYAVITLARSKWQDAIARGMLLQRIAEVLELEQLNDLITTFIHPFLLFLFLEGDDVVSAQ